LRIDPNNVNAKKNLEEARQKRTGAKSYSGESYESNSNSFTDSRDGKKYKIVKIGSQTWMAENLNYNASGSKCYSNELDACNMFGRLYNWATAMKVCPYGWHLPTKAEWNVLTAKVGGSKIGGKYLKAVSWWDSFNGKSGNGTDSYGFTAMPGGMAAGDDFGGIGKGVGFWSATEYSTYNAYLIGISYDSNDANLSHDDKRYSASVRCLQD